MTSRPEGLIGAGSSATVRASPSAPRWARVEVTDLGPVENPSAARNGWGLTIVADVTDRTGATIQLDGGRVAWTEVTWPMALQAVGPSLGPTAEL